MTVPHNGRWVMDTSTFTHFLRAGRGSVLQRLAPAGLILIPDTVNAEVETGRDLGYDIPTIASLPWVELGVLTPAEGDTQLLIKVEMPSPDDPRKNLRECAVLACAEHRSMIAVIDDGDARTQARARGLRFVTSMWIIAEAYRVLDDVDAEAAEQIYEVCAKQGCDCPTLRVSFGWAYSVGLLP